MHDYNTAVKELVNRLETSDAIVVGAASGMSAAAGYRHYYERDADFVKYFSDFEKKYGFRCTFDGVYYKYKKSEQRWAMFARLVSMILRAQTGKPYYDIYDILQGKNYHILTTNQDTQFTRLFSEDKISAIQGDFRYLQCRRPCCDELYNAEELYYKLNDAIDENLEIPTDMIPRCKHCGGELEPWVRSRVFLEGEKYREEHRKINEFLQKNHTKNVLFLELGVGRMTPMFIQEPFWKMTYAWQNAFYITINPNHAILPDFIKDKGIAIHDDIAKVLDDVNKIMKGEKQ